MRTARLILQFNFSGTRPHVTFVGSVDVIRFSRDQYEWHEDGPNGHPIRSLPPARFTQGASSFYDLPPYSLTVLRGILPVRYHLFFTRYRLSASALGRI